MAISKPLWSMYDVNISNPEHMLAESLITEYMDIIGVDIDYYIRDENIVYDNLYGEHTMTGYEEPKRTKLLYDVAEEPNLWSSFGMFGGDIITAQIPQYMFSRDVSSTILPKIGDVISILWYPSSTDRLVRDGREFEIVHVDDDDKIFTLKKLIWVFVLRPYRFSEQSQTAEDITESHPLSAYGDNEWIISESNEIRFDDYTDDDYFNVN